MKNNTKLQALSLRLFNHRIIRIKANAFLKLFLHAESSDTDSASQSGNLKYEQIKFLVKSVLKCQESIQKEMERGALEKIKLAGWKLIPEAHAEDQEDSLAVSRNIEEKISQSEVTLLPASVILRDITNYPNSSCLNSSGISPIMRSKVNSKHISCQQITIDTSRSSQKQLQIRKRALIIKKLENVEMCVDYMRFSSQLQGQRRHVASEGARLLR